MGSNFDGPFEIVERMGSSCVKVRVGSYANGKPRLEVQHWSNCKPAVLAQGAQEGQKVARGRKKKPPDITTNVEVPDNTSTTNQNITTRSGRTSRKPDRYSS